VIHNINNKCDSSQREGSTTPLLPPTPEYMSHCIHWGVTDDEVHSSRVSKFRRFKKPQKKIAGYTSKGEIKIQAEAYLVYEREEAEGICA